MVNLGFYSPRAVFVFGCKMHFLLFWLTSAPEVLKAAWLLFIPSAILARGAVVLYRHEVELRGGPVIMTMTHMVPVTQNQHPT